MYQIYAILASSAVFACYGLAMPWLSAGLLGRERGGRLTLAYFLYFLLLQWAVNLFIMFTQWDPQGLWYSLGVFSAHALVLGLMLWRMLRVPAAEAFSAALLSNFVIFTCGSVVERLMIGWFPDLENIYLIGLVYSLAPHLFMLLLSRLAVLLLHRSGFHRYFAHLFERRWSAALTLAVSFLLMGIWPVVDTLYPDAEASFGYVSFFFGLVLAALFGLQFLAMYAASQDKIRAQEELIAQQQAHMALLEQLQQEVRAFRHDFTNLFSGLTLQAQAGDLAAVQDFLRQTSRYFDEKLGSEIQQMDSLNNIRLYPLRSLIGTKLAAMRRERISASLEVLRPVTGTQSMGTEDLLRALGILLDNAIEGAASEDGQVRLVLLQEGRGLYIAVANNFDTPPDLTALAQKGYTTKGSGHGTGLTSYRRILARYPGCLTRSYLRDGFFVQELRMSAV